MLAKEFLQQRQRSKFPHVPVFSNIRFCRERKKQQKLKKEKQPDYGTVLAIDSDMNKDVQLETEELRDKKPFISFLAYPLIWIYRNYSLCFCLNCNWF